MNQTVDFKAALEPDWVRLLARDIIGTDDPEAVDLLVKQTGQLVFADSSFECVHFEVSVGAVFILEGAVGRRAVVKIMAPDVTLADAQARFAFQRYLHASNYPCPEPLIEPVKLEGLVVVAEAYEDRGRPADGHHALDRGLMATELRRLMMLSANYPKKARFPTQTLVEIPGSLWPKPHNVLFDFEREAERAAWIDDLAAKYKLDWATSRSPNYIGHMDWSAKHCRIDQDRISVVYDWDSTARLPETRIIGSAAASFLYTDDRTRTPEFSEVSAFLAAYEDARHARFSEEELREIEHALMYGVAYGARCEDAIDFGQADASPWAREFLASLSKLNVLERLRS